MKKFKYLISVIILVLLYIYLYQNYIYYKISYNPISEYSAEDLSSFHITKNLSNGGEESVSSSDSNICDLILKYFSELKLQPLKEKAAWNEYFKQENSAYFTGMLSFNQSDKVYISDILSDNLTILRISSNIPGFKEGYYKIIDAEFDYDYIYNLIGH